MPTFDWSNMAPFVARVKTAAHSGVMAMGKEVQADIQRSFKRMGKFKSSPPGQPPAKQRGGLHDSIEVQSAGDMMARVGSNKKYAEVQEFGKHIAAVNVRHLRIPLNDAAVRLNGKSGAKDGTFTSLRSLGNFRFFRSKALNLLAVGDKGVRVETYYNGAASGQRRKKVTNDLPLFMLKDTVNIPARPFIAPALKRTQGSRPLVTAFCRAVNNNLKAAGISAKVRPA